MNNIKVGVIGTGFIGPSHIEALRRIGNIDIKAIADVNPVMARQKSKIFNIRESYGDYRELLSDKSVEVVHICTPNNLHHQMVKDALIQGKHVICEKPLAMDSIEAEELVKIARDKKMVNAINFNIRFYPLIHQAKIMVQEGRLGRIFAVNGSYQQDWLLLETDYNWRLDRQFSGASRAIADIGSHWLDAIEFILAKRIKKVFADSATFHKFRKKPAKYIETFSGKILEQSDYEKIPINTEDYATVLLRFEDEVHGSLTVNQAAAGRKNRLYFEIYGSKASISFDSENPNMMWIGHRECSNEVMLKDPGILCDGARDISSYPGGHNEGFPDTLKQLFTKIYKFIKANNKKDALPDFPTFKDGLTQLKTCEAIEESVKAQSWIKV